MEAMVVLVEALAVLAGLMAVAVAVVVDLQALEVGALAVLAQFGLFTPEVLAHSRLLARVHLNF
jgi:hypothetical protein